MVIHLHLFILNYSVRQASVRRSKFVRDWWKIVDWCYGSGVWLLFWEVCRSWVIIAIRWRNWGDFFADVRSVCCSMSRFIVVSLLSPNIRCHHLTPNITSSSVIHHYWILIPSYSPSTTPSLSPPFPYQSTWYLPIQDLIPSWIIKWRTYFLFSGSEKGGRWRRKALYL